MEEIWVHGVYEKLVDQVRDLPTAENSPTLYEKILARYEEDYETDRRSCRKDNAAYPGV
jgi:hypothetical protein